MSRRHRSADQPLRMLPMALYIAGLAFTVVLAAGLVLLGFRWVGAPAAAPGTLQAQNLPAAPTPAATPGATSASGAAAGQVPATRLVVPTARRLLDRTVKPAGGADVLLPLPRSGASAVLLQVSLSATGPGAVSVRSKVEDVPALRVPRAGAQTSATVVVLVGMDHRVRVSSTGGGRLVVQLTGIFERADSATSGRVVALPAQRILTLRPLQDGRHDAVVDALRVPAVHAVGSVSAVVLHVTAEVGDHGGHLAEGRSLRQANQVIYWSATSSGDRDAARLPDRPRPLQRQVPPVLQGGDLPRGRRRGRRHRRWRTAVHDRARGPRAPVPGPRGQRDQGRTHRRPADPRERARRRAAGSCVGRPAHPQRHRRHSRGRQRHGPGHEGAGRALRRRGQAAFDPDPQRRRQRCRECHRSVARGGHSDPSRARLARLTAALSDRVFVSSTISDLARAALRAAVFRSSKESSRAANRRRSGGRMCWRCGCVTSREQLDERRGTHG